MELQVALLTLFQLLLVAVSPAQLQHFYHPHAHSHRPQLYYDAAPRLRRLEYSPAPAPAPFLSSFVPSPAAHYQQHTPNFQLINYRPSYQPVALEYQQQQPPVHPAAPLSAIYPQPSVQYVQRSLSPHAELAKYRYEGNYMPQQHRVAIAPQQPQPLQHQQQQQQQQQRRIEDQQYNVPPALFTSDVLHVVPSRMASLQQQQQQLQQAERSRRYTNDLDVDAVAAESRSDTVKPQETKETKYFHDIFMRFDGANGRSHGHVLEHPKAQERRFETQRGTNRYKGEVIWTDRRGGHGEHRWDLAQGKL